ncbi:uncharacterized protein [Lolium perenne]|uniref:uncharacterized protein isoform X1 n=1 Tax=Lolium perenne TaxID=4522 RepID=UPI0021F5A134|nr:uncharacterized protein LOC127334630 isoform X2 [Lolium perenne]XP_051217106.1 uncharacterized protein LOC127334630 isoform X2 [Lolium perenne]XP_051217107.1 uncharacterized protein LOC127334630 isoform X2 [Lolium perenne]XP_051217108.1 uncharacterized protein LOC127334630 isoform X2 [Lolium perenne]
MVEAGIMAMVFLSAAGGAGWHRWHAVLEVGGRVGDVEDERNRKATAFAGEAEVVGGEGGVVFPLYKAFQHRNRTPHLMCHCGIGIMANGRLRHCWCRMPRRLALAGGSFLFFCQCSTLEKGKLSHLAFPPSNQAIIKTSTLPRHETSSISIVIDKPPSCTLPSRVNMLSRLQPARAARSTTPSWMPLPPWILSIQIKHKASVGASVKLVCMLVFYFDADVMVLFSLLIKLSQLSHSSLDALNCCFPLSFVVVAVFSHGPQAGRVLCKGARFVPLQFQSGNQRHPSARLSLCILSIVNDGFTLKQFIYRYSSKGLCEFPLRCFKYRVSTLPQKKYNRVLIS